MLTWLQDRQQSIPAQAFTVILHDGTFCLRPQTAQLWLNQAKVTATSDLIQLRQGDEIQIGRLMVRVHLNRGDIPHYDEEMATPETIVTNRDMLTDTPLPDVLGKNYIDHQDFNLLPDTIKTLPPVKLDEKTQFIGVVAYFSDDQATEWKQIETVEGTGHHYRLLVHVRQSSIEMKKEDE